MKDPKDKNLQERLQKAAAAKQAILERMRARPGADDPEVIARRAAQQAAATAKGLAAEARKAAKAKAEAERVEAEARTMAETAAQREREAADKVETDRLKAIEQKAARDARYAARKARKG